VDGVGQVAHGLGVLLVEAVEQPALGVGGNKALAGGDGVVEQGQGLGPLAVAAEQQAGPVAIVGARPRLGGIAGLPQGEVEGLLVGELQLALDQGELELG
jgi:hypothetical protein